MTFKEKLLYFDIETVGVTETLEDLKNSEDPKHQALYESFPSVSSWWRRRNPRTEELTDEEIYYEYSGLIPEYLKIVCVSFGYTNPKTKDFEITSYHGSDEKKLLELTSNLIKRAGDIGWLLCGHNIITFDCDAIMKRLVYHGLEIPSILPKPLDKPWTITDRIVDTKNEWTGNAFKPSNLKLLCAYLGVDSPKEGEVNGENLHKTYWENKDTKIIADYCERDITAQRGVTEKLIDVGIITKR